MAKEKKKQEIEQKYFIRIFDDIEGEMHDPIEFTAVKRKFDGTFWLINEELVGTSLNNIPNFDRVLIPSSQKLRYEDKYKTLEQVEKAIKEVEAILEDGEVPEEHQDEKNILDYEKDLYELSLLEDKLKFGKSKFIQRDKTGRPVLTYIRKGNVPLSLSYNVNTRKIWLPTDQQIQNYTSRNREIDFMYPLKKESKINFKNVVTLFMLLLCGFFIWGIYDNKQTAQEYRNEVVMCQDNNAKINERWAESNERQINKISEAIDKIAIKQQESTTPSLYDEAPPDLR